MKCMIERLTDEQIARQAEYVKTWTDIGLSTAPADRPRAESAIRDMYRIAGLAPPQTIVWCGSPMSQGLTRAILMNDSVRESVGESVRDSVRASVGASVGASVWARVRDSVGDSVGDSVWDSVGESVGESVRASVGESVWESVRDSVRESVRASVRVSVWESVRASVYGSHDAGWLAFYKYFRDVVGLTEQTAKLSGLLEIAQSSGWALPHEKICWVSERHNLLSRDERGRLHSTSGPACAYPDGWGIYAWHGTRIPAEWITNPSALTASTAVSQSNIELRRAACEILGWANILRDLNARTINADKDPLIGTLVEVDLPDVGPARFLRVTCGTGREFAIGVPPSTKTALAAQAWMVGLNTKQFKAPEIRT